MGDDDDIAFNKQHSTIGDACQVKLVDFVRGIPQRVESQFRTHWNFTPAMWNLHFRERVNLG